ncbi:MAG: PAS domain-containing sensor histidine kinase [Elusimicrobiota bacterium]|nr:PAS domain-containing sensor histidine kinase [Elusimicrobiota bacterium]
MKKSNKRSEKTAGLRRQLERLQASRAGYFDLYDQAPVGYLTLDGNGLILTANFTAAKMFAAGTRPFIGQPLTRFILPEDQDNFYLHRRELEKGAARYCELRMLHTESVPFWVRLDSSAGPGPGGGPLCRVTVIDITDRKKIEAEKQLLLQRLAEKEKELEDFLYTVAHDIRTPLICVQGFTEHLVKDLKQLAGLLKPAALPEEIRRAALEITGSLVPESLESITEGASKISQLVDALIKVARLGQLKMSPETLDAEAVVKKVRAALAYQVKKAGAEVKIEALPPCTADPAAFNQIVTNLLDNALKCRDKSRKLKITVRGEKIGGTVRYTIADNGLGIKQEDLPRIWRIFFSGQLPGVKKGEGIGLSMVRRLAEKCFGRIWAESKEGEGSVFYIEMPA